MRESNIDKVISKTLMTEEICEGNIDEVILITEVTYEGNNVEIMFKTIIKQPPSNWWGVAL